MAQKLMYKQRLHSAEQIEHAKLECAIHSSMDHINIVKLYEYTETEEEIRMFLEVINNPSYFSDKLEVVCRYITFSITTIYILMTYNLGRK